jgi:hypothetical protein
MITEIDTAQHSGNVHELGSNPQIPSPVIIRERCPPIPFTKTPLNEKSIALQRQARRRRDRLKQQRSKARQADDAFQEQKQAANTRDF